MVVATSSGEFRKTYSANGSFTFPVGDNTGSAEYSPVILNFTSGSYSSAYASVKLSNSKYSNNSSSTDYINRYWTVTTSGITSPVCTATFTYCDGDIVGTESNLFGGRYLSASWNFMSAVNTGDNTFSSSISSFGEFTAGEAQVIIGSISWKASPGNSSWNTASNWAEGIVPTSSTDVVLPTGASAYPTIDAEANCRNLTIQTGANLTCSENNTLNVYGNWSVAGTGYFNATNGSVVFKKTGTQSITMTANVNDHFYNLSTGDGAVANIVNLGSNINIDGNLTITTNSTLDATASNYNINVAGNWSNSGTFNENSGTVTFDGNTLQTLTGETFYNLTINNSHATPNDENDVDASAAITVSNILTISDGQFQPNTGSSFKDVTISANGILKPDASANINSSGNWTNAGSFVDNSGTITFNGTSTIITGGTGDTQDFYNVVLNGTSATLSTNNIDIDNNFTITEGIWKVCGTSCYDMYVAGQDWTNNGTFDCSSDNMGFDEDFSDGDYTNNPTWSVQAGGGLGPFEVNSGILRTDGSASQGRISTSSPPSYGLWEFDYKISDVYSSNVIEFFFSYTSTSGHPGGNGYMLYISNRKDAGDDDGWFRLYRVDNGVETLLKAATISNPSSGTTYTAKIQRMSNGMFKIYHNGSLKITEKDKTYTAGSRMGFIIYGFDNTETQKQTIDNITIREGTGIGGTVFFDRSGGQNILGDSITAYNNLTINNSTAGDGGVSLEQDIEVINTLEMSDGSLNMANNNINLGNVGQLSNETNDNRVYTDGTGTGEIYTTRTINAPSDENIAGLGAYLTDVNNLGICSVQRGHKIQTGSDINSIKRYYDITVTNQPTSATLKVTFFTKELNDLNPSSLTLWKSTDSRVTWTDVSGTYTDANPDYITKTGITSFSGWVPATLEEPTPIKLLSFNGECLSGYKKFNWITSTEINNNYFTIESSINGKDFNYVENIKGAGNSNVIKTYKYNYINQSDNANYFRLKQTDFDGEYSYSNIISVECSNENDKLNIDYIAVSDNIIKVFFNYKEGQNYCLKLFNQNGQYIKNINGISVNGTNMIDIDRAGISAGLYFIILESGNKVDTERLFIN